MNAGIAKIILRYLMALVWLLNGLFCKILNLVPRHQAIVGELLNAEWSRELTILIGLGEIFIAFWIVSNLKVKLHTILQVFLVGVMNVLEFLLVPELLLWGKLNIGFAGVFILLVIYHFYLNSHE